MAKTKYKTDSYPYQVYTALLTQSGSDGPAGVAGDGEVITIGVTYEITENPDNYDLTIYGAPNNNAGTYFVANQTINLPYTLSLQLLYNTGAPVVTVLENTIGDIWFTYSAVGTYYCYSNGLFTELKTTLSIGNIRDDDGYASVANIGLDVLTINNFTIITSPFQSNTDGKLLNTPIEIRVYN